MSETNDTPAKLKSFFTKYGNTEILDRLNGKIEMTKTKISDISGLVQRINDKITGLQEEITRKEKLIASTSSDNNDKAQELILANQRITALLETINTYKGIINPDTLDKISTLIDSIDLLEPDTLSKAIESIENILKPQAGGARRKRSHNKKSRKSKKGGMKKKRNHRSMKRKHSNKRKTMKKSKKHMRKTRKH